MKSAHSVLPFEAEQAARPMLREEPERQVALEEPERQVAVEEEPVVRPQGFVVRELEPLALRP